LFDNIVSSANYLPAGLKKSDPSSWPLARTVGVVETSQLAIDLIPPRRADEQPAAPYRNRCEHQRIVVRGPERDHDVEQSVVCAMAAAQEATSFDRITAIGVAG
jgi:hypothetical protein